MKKKQKTNMLFQGNLRKIFQQIGVNLEKN